MIPQARRALDEPGYRIVTTDAETIATRTDKWDPGTETSRYARAAAALATERQEVLSRAQARIDELIGLEDAKEQIAVWRTEIQIDQLLAEQGDAGTLAATRITWFSWGRRVRPKPPSRAWSAKCCSGWARLSAPTSKRSPRKTSLSAMCRRPRRG